MRQRRYTKDIDAIRLRASVWTGEIKPVVFGICDSPQDDDGKQPYLYALAVDPATRQPYVTTEPPDLYIPRRLEKLLYPKRNKIIYGGRGSAKTRTVAKVILELIRLYDCRVVCLRETLKSIAKSSYQELRDEAHDREIIGSEIKITNSEIRSHLGRGLCVFDGLTSNEVNIKGYAGFNIAWVEEAENVKKRGWDILRPTLRADGSEIWVTFNPAFESDPTWQEFVAPYVDQMVDGIYEDEENLIIQCNHIHNPWFPETLKKEMAIMRERDPERCDYVYEGMFYHASQAQVFHGKTEIRDFEPGPDWGEPFYGADFGFSQDPSTLVKVYIHDDTIYVRNELCQKHVEINDYDDWYASMPGIRKYDKIWADEARPDLISHLKGLGWNIAGAEKTHTTNSIEDGITFLRSAEKIVVHPSCTNLIKEIDMYRHKIDPKTEEIMRDVVDAYNHSWDAIRYALVKEIKYKRSFWHVG